MVIQTDADGTIYHGNLLVSLGWAYLFYLLKKGKYLELIERLLQLPLFYFVSFIPKFTYTAFIPFKDCPLSLIDKIDNKLNKKWLNQISKLNPKKIIIITRQEKAVLLGFISRNKILKKFNFEIISNEAQIKNKKFTGKVNIRITPTSKYKFVKKDLLFIGDFHDYMRYGCKNRNFILV
ncbi:hypothetical protein CMO93_02240 [Candidatus Woesearchaeota archaeon]|nr:hypothetical protein [Candidatus Woesearchaeota archaeon]|tara:strand:+ start:3476 stop:4012 length:537 start_codon:yes stop_codon:yes gene_type:complete